MVAERLLGQLDVERYAAPLVLEGGSIHVDGAGTLLTSEECLLNPNRNPGLDRAAIESLLRGHLGAEAFVWLGQGLDKDETDGHVDNIDRKSVVEGKSVSVSVDLGGRRIIKKKREQTMKRKTI